MKLTQKKKKKKIYQIKNDAHAFMQLQCIFMQFTKKSEDFWSYIFNNYNVKCSSSDEESVRGVMCVCKQVYCISCEIIC